MNPALARFQDIRSGGGLLVHRSAAGRRGDRACARRAAAAHGAQWRALLRGALLDRRRVDRCVADERRGRLRRAGDDRRRRAPGRRLRRARRPWRHDPGGLRPDRRHLRADARRRARDPRPPPRADRRTRCVAAEVVLADGRAVRCDEHEEADLFWALRGAGGARVGVVTSLEYATVLAPEMTAFETFWDDPAAVIAAWQEWAPDAPDALAASLLITAPPLQVKVFGAFAGPEEELRALARRARRAALGGRRAGVGPRGQALPGRPRRRGRGRRGPRLPALGVLRATASRRRRSRRWSTTSRAAASPRARLLPVGWRVHPRRRSSATAFAHRNARFLLKHAARSTRGRRPPRRASGSTARGRSRTRSGPAASTPTSPRTGSTRGRASTSDRTASGCSSVKRRYDPDGVFG